jgi:hypothetical protein
MAIKPLGVTRPEARVLLLRVAKSSSKMVPSSLSVKRKMLSLVVLQAW